MRSGRGHPCKQSGRASANAGPSLSVDSLDLRLHGSNTIGAKLAPALAKAYAEKNGLSLASENILRSEEVDVEYGKAESTRRFDFRFKTHGSETALESLLRARRILAWRPGAPMRKSKLRFRRRALETYAARWRTLSHSTASPSCQQG